MTCRHVVTVDVSSPVAMETRQVLVLDHPRVTRNSSPRLDLFYPEQDLSTLVLRIATDVLLYIYSEIFFLKLYIYCGIYV